MVMVYKKVKGNCMYLENWRTRGITDILHETPKIVFILNLRKKQNKEVKRAIKERKDFKNEMKKGRGKKE